MIILINGNGQLGISQKLSDIKKDFDQNSIQEISAKNDFDQALIQVSTSGLFSDKRLVILDEVNEKVDLAKLPNTQDMTIVLVVRKNLITGSTLLKQATQLKIQTFNFTEVSETPIFPFIDALADKKPQVMQILESHLDEWGGQYVLTMIFYMLRRMIEDPKKLPPFIQQRITKQRQNFPLEKIADLYRAGLETDFRIKSGLIEEKVAMTLLVKQILSA